MPCPNHFDRVPIVLDKSNLFWLGSNHFRQVQISPEKSNLTDQNNLEITKTICTRSKHFGPLEGQSIIKREYQRKNI